MTDADEHVPSISPTDLHPGRTRHIELHGRTVTLAASRTRGGGSPRSYEFFTEREARQVFDTLRWLDIMESEGR